MGKQPAKNNLIMILDVLKRHSDTDHKLTQKQIQEYVQLDFGVKCDRKAVKRNLMNLVEFGFDIDYIEIKRRVKIKNGSEVRSAENVIITDIYYNHHFEDSEVKLLTDGLLFSKYISEKETKKLISKIEAQSSPFSVNKLKDSLNYEALGHTENRQVLLTVELINEAIKNGRQVEFFYCDHGADKKLHRKKDHKYRVNPYYTVTSGGRYYLIANVDKYTNIANFRIDKIMETRTCSSPVKDIRKLDGCRQGFDLSHYMQEHIYMFSGESVLARLEIDNSIIGQVIDWFGKDFNVITQSGSKCTISLTVNENALFYWAMQYGEFVKVLAPQSVVNRIRSAVKDMASKYEP